MAKKHSASRNARMALSKDDCLRSGHIYVPSKAYVNKKGVESRRSHQCKKRPTSRKTGGSRKGLSRSACGTAGRYWVPSRVISRGKNKGSRKSGHCARKDYKKGVAHAQHSKSQCTGAGRHWVPSRVITRGPRKGMRSPSKCARTGYGLKKSGSRKLHAQHSRSSCVGSGRHWIPSRVISRGPRKGMKSPSRCARKDYNPNKPKRVNKKKSASRSVSQKSKSASKSKSRSRSASSKARKAAKKTISQLLRAHAPK